MDGAALTTDNGPSIIDESTLTPLTRHMNVTRLWDPDTLRPLHVVMIVIICATLAGVYFLLSAPESTELVDGARAWQPNSWLRAIVSILCLNYNFPAFHADAAKSLAFALGAGLALIVMGVAVVTGSAPGDVRTEADIIAAEAGGAEADAGAGPAAPITRRQLAPLVAAQIMAAAYLAWSLVSCGWSRAPEIALGGTALLAFQLFWAFTLGNTLNRAAARVSALALMILAATAAGLAVWYFDVRNPRLRAKFPFGNPIVLASCLLPGLLIAFSQAWGLVVGRPAGWNPSPSGGRQTGASRAARWKRAPAFVAALLLLGLMGGAFYISDSRGPQAGLVIGLCVWLFFILPPGRRWVAAALAVAASAAGWMLFVQVMATPSETGRDASARVRPYAWSYALEMFEQRPLLGHGQGSFALMGDSYSALPRPDVNFLGQSDVELDPMALSARLDHAHNEWLEVLADLGSVGVVLLAVMLLLTLLAGVAALEDMASAAQRATLIGLMASLVALCVAEFFGVGLRLAAVPAVLYTVVGLIWALAKSSSTDVMAAISASRVGRPAFLVAALLCGLVTLGAGRSEWSAAMNVYRADVLVGQQKYEEAIALLGGAPRELSPARAIRDMNRHADVLMQWSSILQTRCFDRLQRAASTDPPDAAMMRMAEADRAASLRHHEMSRQIVEQVQRYAPGYYSSGWVQYWLSRISYAFASAAGDDQAAQNFVGAMVGALSGELARHPYSLSVTLEYLRVAGGALAFPDFLYTLVRPLRHQPVSASFAEFATQLSDGPDFNATFTPVFQDAIAQASRAVMPPPEDRAGQWVPEVLRFGATVQASRGDYGPAVQTLEVAASAYEKMSLLEAAAMGAAGCWMELAEMRFRAAPLDVAPALQALDRSDALAPDSEIGRGFRADNDLMRRALYLLAAGDEQAVRDIVRRAAGIADDEGDENGDDDGDEAILQSHLGRLYGDLCYQILMRPAAEVPAPYEQWLSRALELEPRNATAQSLAADLAFRKGDYAATAEHLRQALRLGASVESVIRTLAYVRQQKWDAEPIEALWRELVPPEQWGPPPAEPEVEYPGPPAPSRPPVERPAAESPAAEAPAPPGG